MRINSSAHSRQQGVAAIEFALTATLLLIVIWTIISYGALFWAQQKLSNLAGDGARMAFAASLQGNNEPGRYACDRIQDQSLRDPLLLLMDGARCNPYPPVETACPWTHNAETPCTSITITVIADVSKWPLLSELYKLASVIDEHAANWVPQELTAKSTIKI